MSPLSPSSSLLPLLRQRQLSPLVKLMSTRPVEVQWGLLCTGRVRRLEPMQFDLQSPTDTEVRL